MSTKVWSEISSRKSDGTVVRLRIEEFTKGQIDEIIEFLGEYFINSENLMRASGAYKREESKKELKDVTMTKGFTFKLTLKEINGLVNFCKISSSAYKREESKKELLFKYSLMLSHPNMRCQVCYSEDDPSKSIIGASMMILDDEHLEKETKKLFELTKTPEGKKMIEIIFALRSLGDVKKRLGVEKSYTGKGIVVKPEYRCLGIAKEFVKIRRKICEEEGVPCTDALMTALGTQKAAESVGWETVFQIPYDELGKMFGVVFDTAPPLCKVMAVKA